MGLLLFTQCVAKEFKFWGKQVRGTGPGRNAQVTFKNLLINNSAKIIRVSGSGNYCIWEEGMRRGYLCSKNRNNLVGKVLPKGKYTIYLILENMIVLQLEL